MLRWSGLKRKIALALIYFLVAAAAFSGFVQKHGFQKDGSPVSTDKVLDGSVLRPFAYRQLDPWLAELTADAIPPGLQAKIAERYTDRLGGSALGPDEATRHGPRYFVEYTVLYYVTFLELFASLFVLRALFGAFVGPVAATLAPAIVALQMPVLQAIPAGFYYDFGELLFIAVAALAAVRGRVVLLAAATVLGTLNKESFFFFIPTLAPFLLGKGLRADGTSARRVALILLPMLLISGSIYLALKARYGGNPGSDVDPNLAQNIRFFVDPRNLFRFDKPYGVFAPRPYSLFWLSAVALVIASAWRNADPRLRWHAAMALAINLPLFILFCAPGEMRDFGLCLVALGVFIAYAVDAWLAGEQAYRPGDGAWRPA